MVPVGLRFELFVEDVERSVAFYAAALGLRPADGYDPRGYVPVSAGQVRIGLQRRIALPGDHHFRPAHFTGPRGVGVEIVIEVDDVHAAYARARDAAADRGGHVTAVGAVWVDGTFWFQTGTGTRKGRNVARDPRCSVSLSVRDADVVFEGDAVRVTGRDALAPVTKAWAANGWPVEPDASGQGVTAPFNAPSQGPPPWNVYRIEPRSAIVTLGAEPGGLTRFRF
jgi:predicted enzyme related to lactoylglutathione lyase